MNEHESEGESKFLNFRDEQFEKQRKQQELKIEYQKFKAMDEERFRNRFAHKKMTTVNAGASGPSNRKKEQFTNTGGSNMDVLLKKLDILQKSVENLKELHSNPNPSHESVHENENQLSDYVELEKGPSITDQAAKQFAELEREIKSLKVLENNEIQAETVRASNCSLKNDNVPYQTEYFLHREDPSARKRRKQIEKERYAYELKQQIEEKQRLKEQQRRRDCEEDLIKLAEARDYDNLGHRIRDRSGESFFRGLRIPDRNFVTYARGGNEMFCSPSTESQKMANETYRNQLMLQIEEKRLEGAGRLHEGEEPESLESQRERKETALIKPTPEPQNLKSPEPTLVSSPDKIGIRKQSACIQVALEHRPCRLKAKKLVRISSLKEKTRKFPKYEELLAQVNQLKIVLAAEKLRMEQDGYKTADLIHIYDPRSVPEDPVTPSTWFVSRRLKRQTRVHRIITAPAYSRKTKSRFDRQFALSSSSLFLPQPRQSVSKSPSVGSLNLEETNRQMRRKLEELRVSDEVDDLYKNEDPIIREFMAKEEARLIANSEYH